MIHIYQYQPTFTLIKNDFKRLDDNTMFNDKITIYKNMNNKINFKIRNRDRVTQTPKMVILCVKRFDTDIIVLQKYLEFIEDEKNYYVNISAKTLENLDTNTKYSYFIAFEDENGVNPLYLDHNYNINGIFDVLESHKIPVSKTIKFTSDLISEEFLTIDYKTISVAYIDKSNTLSTTKVIIEKVDRSRGNVDVTNNHWDEYMTITVDDFVTPILLPDGRFRIRIESDNYYDKELRIEYI